MLNYKDFLLKEADSPKTNVQKIKADLSQKFDSIADAKALKKPGDVNSEIQSITQQATIYQEISNMMKSLAAEMKKVSAEKAAPKSEDIY
jgi:conjugal transfer/entry exclusion protein